MSSFRKSNKELNLEVFYLDENGDEYVHCITYYPKGTYFQVSPSDLSIYLDEDGNGNIYLKEEDLKKRRIYYRPNF